MSESKVMGISIHYHGGESSFHKIETPGLYVVQLARFYYDGNSLEMLTDNNILECFEVKEQ